jgi:hypothetical protein
MRNLIRYALAFLRAWTIRVGVVWACQLALAVLILCTTTALAHIRGRALAWGELPSPLGWALWIICNPVTGMAVGLVLTVLRFTRPARLGQQASSEIAP